MRSLDRIFRRNKPNLKTLAQWVKGLFSTGVNGAWYDPSDITRYMSSLGPELVTNGDFSNGTTGWSTGAGWTISGGVAVGTGATGNLLQSNVAPNPTGKTYQVKLTISGRTSGSIVPQIGGSPITLSADGVYTFFLRPSLNDATLYIPGSNFTGSIDNISVRELTDISTATLFQDAAGTTPVTAVGQPVGLMLDKSKGLVLGSDRIVNGAGTSLTGWINLNNWWVVSSGRFYHAPSSAYNEFSQSFSIAPGFFIIEFDYQVVSASGTAQWFYVNALGSVTAFNINSGSGNVKLIIRDGISALGFSRASGLSAEFYIDNISVRELPGNHAYNPSGNSANFPVLSARYNLLTKTEQFDDAVWGKTGTSVTPNTVVAPNGTLTSDKLVEDTSNGVHVITQAATISAGVTYVFSVYLKAAERSKGRVMASSLGSLVNVDLASGTLSGGSGPGYVSSSISSVGDGWYKVVLTYTESTSGSRSHAIYLEDTGGNTYYQGNGESGLYIWGADLRVSNDALNQPAYQRVNTSTDYDTVGFKPYLSFNGVNQWLQTNSIDFTYGDKMFVCAGVRIVGGGSATKFILESGSSDSFSTPNTFAVMHGYSIIEQYAFRTHGSGSAVDVLGAAAIPVTNVVSGIGDISGDSAVLRVNGTQAAISTADQGTGNFGNYPLYIGARAGNSLWFNGRLYGLVVAGKQASASEITSCERYLNQKTGAY